MVTEVSRTFKVSTIVDVMGKQVPLEGTLSVFMEKNTYRFTPRVLSKHSKASNFADALRGLHQEATKHAASTLAPKMKDGQLSLFGDEKFLEEEELELADLDGEEDE